MLVSSLMGMVGNLADVAFLGLYFDKDGKKFVAPTNSNEAKYTCLSLL